MIIVGYQGIGKSTLAKNSHKYIHSADKREDYWQYAESEEEK